MRFCAVAGVGAGLGCVEARDEESYVPVRLCPAWCWEYAGGDAWGGSRQVAPVATDANARR